MLIAPRDWTKHELAELSLWFRGYPPSVGSFTEAPAGTYTMTASGTDITGTADKIKNVDLCRKISVFYMLSGDNNFDLLSFPSS